MPLSKKEISCIMKEKIETVLSIMIPVLILWVLLNKVIAITVVESGSMMPTLQVSYTAVYNRLAYLKTDVKRGDIICFWSDEYNCYMGKRVIGIPGDEIIFKDGDIVINGQYIDESDYLADNIKTFAFLDTEFIVPQNCYFVMGDNRENSKDSRWFDNPYISRENIVGRYIGSIPFSIRMITRSFYL